MFTCDAVDLDYLDTAPIRLSASINVDRPPSEVFAALAHDPANWGEFFPGFDRTGHFYTPAPHGVGSRYTKRLTPGLRTTIASLTATAALCCESPSAASRDLPSNWPPLCCSQYSRA
jgi:hypothetical protein